MRFLQCIGAMKYILSSAYIIEFLITLRKELHVAWRCITCTLIEIFGKMSTLFNAKLTCVFVFGNISSLVSKLAAYFAHVLAVLVLTKKQT